MYAPSAARRRGRALTGSIGLLLAAFLMLCAGAWIDVQAGEQTADAPAIGERTADARQTGRFFQISVIGAIAAGVYDGAATVATLAEHGDFGVGATHALGGELVVLDGKFYEFRADGTSRLLSDDDTVTFAAVTFFQPERTVRLTGAHDDEAVSARLLELMELESIPYAVAVTGRFAHVRTRAPEPQTKPYQPLAEVLQTQAEFDYYDIEGTMVGFWTPDYLSSLHSPGFHFHFVSARAEAADGDVRGGHVLAFRTADVELAVVPQEELVVRFPTDDPVFRDLQL